MCAESGSRFPAEWEDQSAILLVWPHEKTDWQDSLATIDDVYINICQAITASQTCLIVCFSQAHKQHIKHLLNNNGCNTINCHFLIIETNDTWCRDYAVITTRHSNNIILNNFIFNGWGNKYDASLDNNLNDMLVKQKTFKPCNIRHHDFILEGGSIETDGQGTLLTTATCLLKRHPDKTKSEIKAHLIDFLGVKRVVFIKHGKLSGDDTDCHIDNLARFANPATIVYSACNNDNHPDYESLKLMEEELHTLKKEDGTHYKLIPVYIPEPIISDGQILPASYVNFLITNESVLVPVYNQSSDNDAIKNIAEHFPGRITIGIEANTLIKQCGGIHCATMQFPNGVINY